MLAREIHGAAVGEVATVVEVHREDGVPAPQDGFVDGGVRLTTRVGLDVRVVRTEEFFRPRDREFFDLVDLFAAAVVPAAGVAFGVFIREHGAHRLDDGLGDEVLARDQFDREALSAAFAANEPGDFRICLLYTSDAADE